MSATRFYSRLKTISKTTWQSALCIVVGGLFGVVATVSLQAVAKDEGKPSLPLTQIRELAEVFSIIKSDYVEPVKDDKLISDAIAGMVSGLDPHSQYFDPKAFKEFQESTSGDFVGVGIEITQEEGLVKVVSPIEGSPAFRAGLKPNDLIIKVDSTALKGLSLNQAVKRMRGEPNTKVVLTIFRKDENRTFSVTITREEIHTQSVRGKIIEPGYAWIRVSQFQERTVDDFGAKLAALYKESPDLKGLVLDLRNDPGGLLDGAIAVSAAFLPENTVVVSTKGQLPESQMTYRAIPRFYQRHVGQDPIGHLPKIFKTVPIVVLVNEGSASASEIVSGALQDHKRALIMGAQTFGKGSVQSVRFLSNNTAVKLTTARYYTPSGRSIQARGIVPDIFVDETENGDIYGVLRLREADLDKHLENATTEDVKADQEREKARDAARAKLEAEMQKPKSEREIPPEYGTDKDFALKQAFNQLKGLPVVRSKTLVERAEADPADKE